MGRLFLLLFKYRAALVFVALELFCSWLIVSNHLFLGASFFNTSNSVVAKTLGFSNAVNDYFALGVVNTQLLEENAKLKQELLASRQRVYSLDYKIVDDLAIVGQYNFQEAEVIYNSTHWANNYLTIDRGIKSGVTPGMGVVNQYGVVGKIKAVSEHYSVVASLLHTDLMVSSKIKRTGTICTTNWDGNDQQSTSLLYVPRHSSPMVGDSVITSGYNAVFPEGSLIGVIDKVTLNDEDTFYQIDVALSNDFSSLSYVYIIKNELYQEKDSLETLTGIIKDYE